MSELLEAARRYRQRGWMPVPVPPRTKGPRTKGWQNLRLTSEELPAYFGAEGNIGILLGEASGNLVDVDLDCPEAIKLADQYLPATPAVTGRFSAPRSHWWYRSEVPATKQYHDPVTKEMIVELRSSGCQTLVGPSRHDRTDEPYDYLDGEPLAVPAPQLQACVEALFAEVVRRHGRRIEEAPKAAPANAAQKSHVSTAAVLRRARAYLDKMPPAISGQGGHAATFAAAVALVHGFALPAEVAFQMLLEHYNPRCRPPWTERELRHKVSDAASKPHDRPLGWLRDQVRAEGEGHDVEHAARTSPPAPVAAAPAANAGPGDAEPVVRTEDFKCCVAAMSQLNAADVANDSLHLFRLACQCIEHDLTDEEAIVCIHDNLTSQATVCHFSDAEILKHLRFADKRCTRGEGLRSEPYGCVPLGCRAPSSGRLVLSPRQTLPTAEAFIREFYSHPDGSTLHTYAGLFLEWKGNRYVIVEDDALRKRLQTWLHGALKYGRVAPGVKDLVPFDSNPHTVEAALKTIRSHTHLPADVTPPAWLDGDAMRPNPRELLLCRTLNVHIPTGGIIPATPALFTTSALEFDYDPSAPVPVHWLEFLAQLFGDDGESIELLQEWVGYCLMLDTAQQKMLLIVGPKRSGKGTIARVLRELLGHGNAVGPTMSGLAEAFGLQDLIGKSAAIVSDARFGGRDMSTVVERLLCISGEDTLTIHRKYLDAVTMKLAVRFLFLTNELPKFSDASGALAGRFLILQLTTSFYGHEDTGLTEKLLKELPGILLWAMDGWKRLRERGRFVQPASVNAAVHEIENLSSPVGEFVRERCVVGAEHSVEVGRLFEAWKAWCAEVGRDHPGTAASFGRDIRTVVPALGRSRPRVGNDRVLFYEGIGLKQ